MCQKVRIPTLIIFLFHLFFSAYSAAAETFRIGVSLGESGRYQFPSRMQINGYRLWEKNVNLKGGLLGKPVELTILDDGGEADRAVDNYRRLISEDRVDTVFGPYSSGLTAAVAPGVEKAGYPMLAAGASADAIWAQGHKNMFGMWTPASRYSVFMLNVALLSGWNKVGIVFADDSFSTNVAYGAQKWVSRMAGLEVVTFQNFEKGTRDLEALAMELKAAEADLVIMGGHFNESVDMRKAFLNIGWDPKAYFATVGPAVEKYSETLGDDANCTFATSIWEPVVEFPGSEKFVSEFVASYQTVPSYHAATAYAAGQILEEALKISKSSDHDVLRKSLSRLDTFSIIGRYAVDRTGMQIKRFPLLIQWQNGKKEIVWPEDRQTSQPMLDCGE